ncbi:MAG: SCO6880 family protein [Solirubrobacteraceae bacterium]
MSASNPSARTYGNYRRPRSYGVAFLGIVPSITLGVCVVIAMLLMLFVGLVAMIVWVVPVALVFAVLLRPDPLGETPLQRIAPRAAARHARRTRRNQYRSGPISHLPCGTFRLPGLLSPTILSEFEDVYQRPCALLTHPRAAHVTVVLESEPDGAALVDQAPIDQRVSNYGAWLASLAEHRDLLSAQVSIETAPDPGTRLRHELDQVLDPDAPPLARATIDELARVHAAGSDEVRARIALTFTMVDEGRRRSGQEMAVHIARHLGQITQQLASTGAGVARPVDSQRMCEIVHAAYNPHAAEILEHARTAGQPAELCWEDCGPVRAEAHPDYYLHDRALSITYAMSQAPRGEIRETVLQRLLSPHPDVDRKRVTLLYRILTPGEAARIVEADERNAIARVGSVKRPEHRALIERDAAAASAAEEARGASVLTFGMLVTLTVLDPANINKIRAAVLGLAPTARVSLRPMWGSQDSAFAAALPCGLFLPAHLRMPRSLQEIV